MKKPKILTKTKYMAGLQCPRLLWTIFNAPEKIPEKDASSQYRMNQGIIIGELAKKYFPSGIDLSSDDFKKNIEDTKKALKERKGNLFEAGVITGNIYSRADVLLPVGKDKWDIVEVKSSTEVKKEYIEDVAFQKFVYEQFGLKIRRCFLMHINNQYVKDGEIEPKELFVLSEITEEVSDIKDIKKRVSDMFKIIQAKKKPETCIGTYCENPYTCSMMQDCWSNLPDENVFDLYFGGKKSFELYDRGILEIKDIPKDFKLSAKQKIQFECAECGKPKVIKEKIKDFLDGLKYPLYCLDFETINPALPKYDGMRPYQKIPFQFSLHIQEKKGAKTKHISYLADGIDDPRPKLMQELKNSLGNKGSIIVYNQPFEMGVIKECMEAFPEFKKWGEKILGRIIDLLHPFRQFHFYHPSQKGSASIKAVLPAITDLNYKGLDIAEGGTASMEYERITYEEVDKKEKERVRKQLEKYCGLDTLAEVRIIDKLWEIIK